MTGIEAMIMQFKAHLYLRELNVLATAKNSKKNGRKLSDTVKASSLS
jgi:hypothetical protein